MSRGSVNADLTTADRQELRRRGLSEQEARRQLELLRDPPRPAHLIRPCTPGDGIVYLPAERHEQLIALAESAAEAGRCSKFIPASGAASRMFKSLEALLHEPTSAHAEDGHRFLAELDRFAFRDDLAALLEERGEDLARLMAEGDVRSLIRELLDPDGLGYGNRPKALIPFHGHGPSARTAFEEHLIEAGRHIRDSLGGCRVHLTIAPDCRDMFEKHWSEITPRVERAIRGRIHLELSTQAPSTDTLAVDPDGQLFRTADQNLLFRPGGHGALLHNLEELQGDIVLIKNIDNILPEGHRDLVVRWKKILVGHLIDLERRLVNILRTLEKASSSISEPWLTQALRFAAEDLHCPAARDFLAHPDGDPREHLRRWLDRPLRICGVVLNQSEPGGGPFWVRATDGTVSLQIVEKAQIDLADAKQEACVAAATHFNPVDLVCRTRDHRGRPYRLAPYADADAAFVSLKTHEGRPIRCLEHPGLWNGAMGRWNTVFVEVPAATFAPVKTVFDLLRPEHQPAKVIDEARFKVSGDVSGDVSERCS